MQFTQMISNNVDDLLYSQIELVGQGVREGRKQLVIVPDKFSLTMEGLILQRLNLVASFDIEVVSLSRLSNKILLQMPAPKTLTSLGATMIIQSILLQHKEQLLCFRNTINSVSFASIIFDSIAQLKSCNISCEDLQNAITKISNKNLQLKMSDIAFIYQKYQEFLANNYVDSSNKLSLLKNAILESKNYQDTDIHFCQFEDMTEQQYLILRAFIKSANSVSCGALCADKQNKNSHIYNNLHLDKLNSIANELQITPNIIYSKSTLNEINKHIINNLYAVSPQQFNLTENNISLYSAISPTQEVEFVACDIMAKIKKGERFSHFAINCTDLTQYAPIINEIFTSYNIPFWNDTSYQLIDSEGVKLIASVLNLMLEFWQKSDILAYIKNPVLQIPLEDILLMEKIINKYNIKGKKFLSTDKPENCDEEFIKYLQLKEDIFAPIWSMNKQFYEASNVAEQVTILNSFFEKINLEEKLLQISDKLLEQNDLYRSSISRQNYKKITDVLNTMYDILGESQLKLEEFAKTLMTGIKTMEISPMPMSMDCVYVGQTLQSVFTRAEHYYIIGGTESALPAWVSDVGLIADKDIALISQFEIAISPTIRQLNARSKMTILQNFALSQKTFTLTYPLNLAGEIGKPSEALESLCKIFTINNLPMKILFLQDYKDDNNAYDSEYERFIFWHPTKKSIEQHIAMSLKENSIMTEELKTMILFLQKNGLSKALAQILSLINTGEKEENEITVANNIFFGKGSANVTEIEQYYLCPYKHFLEYGLKIKKEEQGELQASDIGSILHSVLEQFGKIIRLKGIQKDSEIADLVTPIFDKTIKQKTYEHFVFMMANTSQIDTLREESIRACRGINYQLSHSKYKIKWIEQSFGNTNYVEKPEIVILKSNKKLKISGKIDRADIYQNKLRIIDYKTSLNSAKFDLLDLYLGKKIQLFYYMYVITKGLNLQSGGSYYLPIHREYSNHFEGEFAGYCLQGVGLNTLENVLAQDEQISFDHPASDIIGCKITSNKATRESGEIALAKSNSLLTAQQLVNLGEYSEKMVNKAVNDICEGVIAPLPIKGACDYCEYKNICRIGIIKQEKIRDNNFEIGAESFNKE